MWCPKFLQQVNCNVCLGIENCQAQLFDTEQLSMTNKNDYIPTQFNYECPYCHGKFMTPAFNINVSSTMKYRCPFCNMTMEGLNNL